MMVFIVPWGRTATCHAKAEGWEWYRGVEERSCRAWVGEFGSHYTVLQRLNALSMPRVRREIGSASANIESLASYFTIAVR